MELYFGRDTFWKCGKCSTIVNLRVGNWLLFNLFTLAFTNTRRGSSASASWASPRKRQSIEARTAEKYAQRPRKNSRNRRVFIHEAKERCRPYFALEMDIWRYMSVSFFENYVQFMYGCLIVVYIVVDVLSRGAKQKCRHHFASQECRRRRSVRSHFASNQKFSASRNISHIINVFLHVLSCLYLYFNA